ncbi:S1C family serine protease [Marinithermus hydrothermalis]|uniref:Peptidase S1 and S6 chymotrypsin/Hap n=1 Tax=Marinithermus hydrothermalis (strain DSM 14884 / JCM 11576 / T1) TaxID=869210 RepID=F2NPD9_MARHT|nr:trypsin-like peptidase domain-containing protein [Marinithermus hydrothermalis]AEB12220.1 peptidase S1 and S6 chymotrypsin/Hap [Marinithermus hydrothermalis DSM 14884]
MVWKRPAVIAGMAALLAVGAAWWTGSSALGQTGSEAPAVAPLNEAQAFLENERNTIGIVKAFGDGVVFVSVRTQPRAVRPALPPGFEEFAPFFQPFVEPPREGTGSGFVIDKDGYILTNFHVIRGADIITVRFHNDPTDYTAKVVGTAPPLDLALLKVDVPPEKLTPIPLGDSDAIQVGQKVIAMGNPFGLEFSVTEGIVSAVRTNPSGADPLVLRVIQTDAAINPGNSGGPLLNSRGEVIGINTFIFTPTAQFGAAQFAGVGFAIPINQAKEVLPELKAGKTLDREALVRSRPRLGVQILDLRNFPERVRERFNLPDRGLMVMEVEPGSPAEEAGLKAPERFVFLSTPSGQTVDLGVDGDVILEADGQPIRNITDLRSVLFTKKPGDTVTLKVWRDGQEVTVRVKVRVIR